MIGRFRSSSVKPVPLSMARAPARSLPSSMVRLLCRVSNPPAGALVPVSGRSIVVLMLPVPPMECGRSALARLNPRGMRRARSLVT
jgi:hypothetical protein